MQVHIPQQNEIVERQNRTTIERTRSSLIECQLPIFLWIEAVTTANYLINCSPTSANHGVTSEEKYSGKKPKVEYLKFLAP